MFKFKGISSTDMQVIIEEEEHFIARASQRYEMTEIEGRDGAIFEEQGYSVVERPILVQCLNIEKIDDILAWLNGEGEFEYKGRKTTARFYSELEPRREACIRIIDTTFIRDPFWNKANDEYVILNESRIKHTEISEELEINNCAGVNAKIDIVSGKTWQETRSGKNLLFYSNKGKEGWNFVSQNGIVNTEADIDGKGVHLSCTKVSTTWAYVFLKMATVDLQKLKANSNYVLSFNIKTNMEASIHNVLINNQTSDAALSNMGNFSNSSDNQWHNISIPITTNDLSVGISNQGIFISGFNSIGDIYITNIQLEEGTIATDYEPYGAMPSPDYPSEIRNVGDNVNLLDDNEYKGLKVDELESQLPYIDVKLKSNTNYISNIFFNDGTTVNTNDGDFIIYVYKEGKKDAIYLPPKVPMIIKNAEEYKYVRILYNSVGQERYAGKTIKGIKLEEGTTPTPYTPYGCGSIDFKVENRNRFNKNTGLNGYYININNGQLLSSANLYTTDYISVEENEIYGYYTVGMNTEGKINIAYYDSNKNYIGRGLSNLSGFRSFTVPTNTKYIRCVCLVSQKDITYLYKNATTQQNYIEHQEQIVSFPLSKGQVLHEGDYLADDGIHPTMKTRIITSDEISLVSSLSYNNVTYCMFPKKEDDVYYSFRAKRKDFYYTHGVSLYANNIINYDDTQAIGKIRIDAALYNYWVGFEIGTTLEEMKEKLKDSVLQYPLKQEIVTPYTPEQQEAYNKLQNLLLYEGYTRITCLDEMKPDIQATYKEILEVEVKNEGNIESRPILKLNKTEAKNVDLTINDVRFKYNFIENEDYAEIDCKEKTTKYDNLNRNRQIEIGYEFPKLLVGKNKIIFNDGDAVLEMKRKDRWL